MKRIFTVLLASLLLIALSCTGAQAAGYTLELNQYVGIYAGPGFATGFVRNVGTDGVYTIVEECFGSDGFIWGRLKSGAGWVRVSDAETEIMEVPFTTRLEAAEELYAGPGASYGYVKNIGKDGVYTILEAISGNDDYLWGRLKSGAGWVRLANLRPELNDTPYVTALEYWLPIYEGPGYDFGYHASVGKNGKYTIVEETIDYEGNLWGRLKSGAGWVDLTYAATAKAEPIIVAFADDALAEQDNCILYAAEDNPYSTRILFVANENLTNVRFNALVPGETLYDSAEPLYFVGTLTESEHFIADVVFYGDMTAYGLSFTDADGQQRQYAVMLSGRNGSIFAREYE